MRPVKKILFIIWSHSFGGGAEALLTTIVNHLNPEKYRIGIIEICHAGVKDEPVNPGITIYDPVTFEGDAEYNKKILYICREPDRVIRKYIPPGYDLYVSFNYQLPSFLLPKGERCIAWIHTSVYDLAEEGMEAYRMLQDAAFEKAARIVSISDITTRSIRELFPGHSDKVVEIYNSADINAVRKRAEGFSGIRLEHPSIISVGRLDDRKNPMRMIEIFRRLSEKNHSVHLYFLGQGELESQAREKAGEYGLHENVHMLGYIENPFPILRQADVCCMASKAEGFPMSLLESIALHVPFASTEVGGAGILANGGKCGRIYSTDEEAVKHIFDLLNTPKELIAEECEKSISRFDLGTYIGKIENLFDEVLGEEAIAAESGAAWDGAEETVLEDRSWYYRFPDGLIPEGSSIILYGAGDMGTNYYHYIKETGVCRIAAWVDADAEKYRRMGKDVTDIGAIASLGYDAVLIAVMREDVAHEIRANLREMGVPDGKALWAKPVF